MAVKPFQPSPEQTRQLIESYVYQGSIPDAEGDVRSQAEVREEALEVFDQPDWETFLRRAEEDYGIMYKA